MSDDMRRQTKPDVRNGVQAAIPSGRGKDVAVDRRPIERAGERPIERKG
ncbi:hypothetical protein NMA58_08335 [Rhizobium sp. YTUHZ045]